MISFLPRSPGIAAFAGNQIGFHASAVIHVQKLDLLMDPHPGAFDQIKIDRQTTGVINGRRCHTGAVQFGLHHFQHHGGRD
jgi:hypothetical protein